MIRQKARNAFRAFTVFLSATFLASAIVIGISLWTGRFNPIFLGYMLILVVIVFGWQAWRQYRWDNSVDGIGPDVPPP
jgi:hypothetical protein